MRTERGSPLFTLTVVVTIGLAVLIGLMVLMMQIRPGFMGMAHFTERHHRVHDVTFGLLVGTAVVGMFAQLRRPSRNIAGQLMALIPWAALGLISVLTSTAVRFAPFPLFTALTLLATVLHPRRREMVGMFSTSRVNQVMLALVVFAAIVLLPVAWTNIGLQRTLTNDHATLGHYGFIAAFSVTVIAVGILASVRPTGWRLLAWVAGILPVLLGVASLVYSGVDSSLGMGWAVASIAWGAAFVATAEVTRGATTLADIATERSNAQRSDVDAVGRGSAEPATSAPRWVYPTALAAVILLALSVIILHVTGDGFRGHAPP
jgi:hypothetical protein